MTSNHSGQDAVIASHYDRLKFGSAAYVDETYSVQKGHKNFYVMSAVIVTADDRNALRKELTELVPDRWWHTSDELRREGGRDDTIQMLQLLQPSSNGCVIVETIEVGEGDDEEDVRSRVLGKLLLAVSQFRGSRGDEVGLVVLEKRKYNEQNHRDRKTRADLVSSGKLPGDLQMVAVSPRTEHLLWLPDAVCSARRQQIVMGKNDLMGAIDARLIKRVKAA